MDNKGWLIIFVLAIIITIAFNGNFNFLGSTYSEDGVCGGYIGCDIYDSQYDCVYIGECEWYDNIEQDNNICPSVCIGMYEIVNNQCSYDNCGSGCGADGILTFATESECQANLPEQPVTCWAKSASGCSSFATFNCTEEYFAIESECSSFVGCPDILYNLPTYINLDADCNTGIVMAGILILIMVFIFVIIFK